MYPKNQKRFYSPQFSELSAVSVRRLAWALGVPMPKAVDVMVGCLCSILDTQKVCACCKDKSKCEKCVFEFAADLPEQTAAFAV